VGENLERARRAARLAADLASTARQCTTQARERVAALHEHPAGAAACTARLQRPGSIVAGRHDELPAGG
jgi:hypothetical protein